MSMATMAEDMRFEKELRKDRERSEQLKRQREWRDKNYKVVKRYRIKGYRIMFKYIHCDQWEEIDTTTCMKESRFLLREYKIAFNRQGIVKIEQDREY